MAKPVFSNQNFIFFVLVLVNSSVSVVGKDSCDSQILQLYVYFSDDYNPSYGYQAIGLFSLPDNYSSETCTFVKTNLLIS